MSEWVNVKVVQKRFNWSKTLEKHYVSTFTQICSDKVADEIMMEHLIKSSLFFFCTQTDTWLYALGFSFQPDLKKGEKVLFFFLWPGISHSPDYVNVFPYFHWWPPALLTSILLIYQLCCGRQPGKWEESLHTTETATQTTRIIPDNMNEYVIVAKAARITVPEVPSGWIVKTLVTPTRFSTIIGSKF